MCARQLVSQNFLIKTSIMLQSQRAAKLWKLAKEVLEWKCFTEIENLLITCKWGQWDQGWDLVSVLIIPVANGSLKYCFSLTPIQNPPLSYACDRVYGFQFKNAAKVFIYTGISQQPIANALEFFFCPPSDIIKDYSEFTLFILLIFFFGF